jgi:hypothetical protein
MFLYDCETGSLSLSEHTLSKKVLRRIRYVEEEGTGGEKIV